MAESKIGEIDIDEVMEKIRQEVLRRRSARAGSPSIPGLEKETNASLRWHHIELVLNQAADNVQAGDGAPLMLSFPRWIRWLARLGGRVVIYVAQVVTVRQGRFNQAILEAMRHVLEGGRSMNQSIVESADRIAALAAEVAQQKEEISRLKRELAEGRSKTGVPEGRVTELRDPSV
jgi:hypothetical protein